MNKTAQGSPDRHKSLTSNNGLLPQYSTDNFRRFQGIRITNSQTSQLHDGLIQECYKNPKMVTNLPAFYRSLISHITWNENTNNTIFDWYDLDQIVEATISE